MDYVISDERWERLVPLLPGKPSDPVYLVGGALRKWGGMPIVEALLLAPALMPNASDAFSEDALTDLTLLALVIAHGADADLDPREVDTLADRLHSLAPHLSGDDVIRLVKEGVKVYLDTRVEGAETVVHRLSGALGAEDREQAYDALKAVAEADEAMHPMESTLLRHVAVAWKLDRD